MQRGGNGNNVHVQSTVQRHGVCQAEAQDLQPVRQRRESDRSQPAARRQMRHRRRGLYLMQHFLIHANVINHRSVRIAKPSSKEKILLTRIHLRQKLHIS